MAQKGPYTHRIFMSFPSLSVTFYGHSYAHVQKASVVIINSPLPSVFALFYFLGYIHTENRSIVVSYGLCTEDFARRNESQPKMEMRNRRLLHVSSLSKRVYCGNRFYTFFIKTAGPFLGLLEKRDV